MNLYLSGLINMPLSLKYFKKPINTFFSTLTNKRTEIILKNGTKILIIKNTPLKNHLGKILRIILVLKNGWVIENYKGNFIFKKKDIFLIQPNTGALFEDFKYMYGFTDFKNKNILDVGGYFGETTVLFGKWGAKKVIVYEPLPEHFSYLKKNIELNKIRAKPVCAAISNKNGVATWSVNETDFYSGGFGLESKGNKKIKINTVSWDNVLKKAVKDNVKFAKVDCEGGEKYLIGVKKDLIKSIPEWVIEYHSPEIRKNLINYFLKCGFNYKEIYSVSSDVGVIKFFVKVK